MARQHCLKIATRHLPRRRAPLASGGQHCPNIACTGAAGAGTRSAASCALGADCPKGLDQRRCVTIGPQRKGHVGQRLEARNTIVRSLVIEDEPQIGAYLGRLLAQLQCVVDTVASVSDARQALDNFKYDLAIVDRMLPDGDALEVVTA